MDDLNSEFPIEEELVMRRRRLKDRRSHRTSRSWLWILLLVPALAWAIILIVVGIVVSVGSSGALVLVGVALSAIGVAPFIYVLLRVISSSRISRARALGPLDTALDDLGEPFLYEWEVPIPRRRVMAANVKLGEGPDLLPPSKGVQSVPAGVAVRFEAQRSAPLYEKEFVEGLNLLMKNKKEEAIEHFAKARDLGFPKVISPSLIAGTLTATIEESEPKAIQWLKEALEYPGPLPDELFLAYLRDLKMTLQLTPHLWMPVRLDYMGAALILVALYLAAGSLANAQETLQLAEEKAGTDPLLAALRAEVKSRLQDWNEVIRITDNIQSTDDASCYSLILRAQAFAAVDQPKVAINVLNQALRAPDLQVELIKLALYQRGLIHEQAGNHNQARRDFERVHARDGSYADVALRLRDGNH
jgi:tetratricopeptide (TPR) repeat protein